EAAKHFTDEIKGLQAYAKRLPSDQAETLRNVVKEAGGNVLEARARLYNRISDDYATFEKLRASNNAPAQVAGDMYNTVDDFIRKLEGTGDEASRRTAKELTRLLEQYATPKIYVMPR